MKTSIIMLTYNQLEYTKICIESIRKYTRSGTYELIIVDNASDDGTIEWLKKQKDIISIFNESNVGFPNGCNQGIDVAIGDNILFLNNDTIVTKNWLNNMLACLLSDNKHGAVSCVTNNCSYAQAIPIQYKNIVEMHTFSASFNKQNPQLWEERLKLIGFCFLVKRSVIAKIGKMDECFSPGNFEDDDYSLRIRKAGYKLILCKDTFIHHFGSVSFKKAPDYNDLLLNNMKKYKRKWGFNPIISQDIRWDILELLDSPKDDGINILEIGCGCGGTLLKIKNEYKNCNLYGIELNLKAAEIASLIENINILNINEKLPNDFFDYIIVSDTSDYNIWVKLPCFSDALKKSGVILADFPNIAHHSVITRIINGSWNVKNDKTQYFSRKQINELLLQSGYNILKFKGIISDSDHNRASELIEKMGNDSDNKEYSVIKYLVCANKNELYNLLKNIDMEKSNRTWIVDQLSSYTPAEIIKAVSNIDNQNSELDLLTYIGIIHFESGKYEKVLPYFEKAILLEKNNRDVLYNIAYYHIFAGNEELSKGYLYHLKTIDSNKYHNLMSLANDFKIS